MNALNTYIKLLDTKKIYIIMFWVIFTIIIGSLFAPKFIQNTNNDFTAPANTDAAKAQKLIKEYFPDKQNNDNHIIILEKENGTINNQVLDSFTANIVNQTEDLQGLDQVSGYSIYQNTPLESIKSQFMSKDGSVSIIIVSIKGDSKLQQNSAEEIRQLVSKDIPKVLIQTKV